MSKLSVGRARNWKLLIVDDETDVTYTLKVGLEHYGFEVDTYNDPGLVLAELDGKSYDLAIFDVRMPGMDGFELFKLYRGAGGKAKVCFFTAFDIYAQEFKEMFPDVRVDGFLKKPMTIQHLAKKVDEILSETSEAAPVLERISSR